MDEVAVEQFLAHYGVKGMHWGIRKAPTKKEQKARAKRQAAANGRRRLSDDDLKHYIERLQNEKKLKTLVEEDLTPGRAFAKKLLSETGKKTITTVAAGGVAYAIKLGVSSLANKNKAGVKVPFKDSVKTNFNAKELADNLHRGGKPKK